MKKIVKKIDKVDPLGITSFKIVGERRTAKFSKKILGKQIRTQMVMHRLSIKFYENGIVIKPWSKQGCSKLQEQEAIFLTNENTDNLKNFLDMFYASKKILDNLDEPKDNLDEPKDRKHITLIPQEDFTDGS